MDPKRFICLTCDLNWLMVYQSPFDIHQCYFCYFAQVHGVRLLHGTTARDPKTMLKEEHIQDLIIAC